MQDQPSVAVWHGVDLDRLSRAELEAAREPLIALDGSGHIVAMSAAAARWAGVAAWQARGRDLAGEFAWCFGTGAATAIASFARSSATCLAVRTAPQRRRPATEVSVVRGATRIYLTLTV